jgi:hypothetical protein
MKSVILRAQYTCVQIKYAVVTQCIHKVLPYIPLLFNVLP